MNPHNPNALPLLKDQLRREQLSRARVYQLLPEKQDYESSYHDGKIGPLRRWPTAQLDGSEDSSRSPEQIVDFRIEE